MAKLRTRSAGLVALLLASLALAVLVGFVWQAWQPTLLANYYRQQLGQAKTNDEVATSLQRLIEVGDAGWPTVLDAMSAKNEVRSKLARQQLLAEVQRWETLSSDAAMSRLATLTHLLAERVDQ